MMRRKRAILTAAGARRIGCPDLTGKQVTFEGITPEGNARRVYHEGVLIARNIATRGSDRGLSVIKES